MILRTVVLLISLLLNSAMYAQVPEHSSQLVLVVTEHWNSIFGELKRFERPDGTGWKAVGGLSSITVGRSGLAGGIGLHDPRDLEGPVKREGDGRAPAGVFYLSTVFSQHAEFGEDLKTPFMHIPGVNQKRCVDDSRSAFYNQIKDRNSVSEDEWEQLLGEEMYIPLYRFGAVVEHNSAERPEGSQSQGGSCIFLHLWRSPSSSTSGCTAMSEESLTPVLRWLDASRVPVLVQLPKSSYERLKLKWQLP